MPLLQQERSRRGRLRVMMRAQLPPLTGTAFVTAAAAIIVPEVRFDPLLATGSLIILISCIAGALLPWERWVRRLLLILAVADIVGVAMVLTALQPYLPVVGILVIFPVLWLAFGFSRRVIPLAVAGALFVSVFPFVTIRGLPQTPLDWLNVVTMPLLITGVALLVSVAAEELRSRRRQLDSAFDAQRAALREARDTEAIARGILQTVNAGVAFFDAHGRLDIANDLAARDAAMIGFRLDQEPFSGVRMYEHDRVTTIPAQEQPIPRALRGEPGEQHFAWIGPLGQQSAILTSTSPVRRDTGEMLGTVIVMYDVTDLAEAVEIREEFLRTVVHELRTPLTAAVGYLDLLEEDPELPSRLAGPLDTVRRGMERLTMRIAELMAASDDGVDLQRVRVDIGHLVEKGVDRLEPAARGRVVRFGTDGIGLESDVDPRRLAQAIGELLTNAMKFGADDMPVIVRVSAHEHHIEIQVSDNGPGMTRAERARAFDSFYRTPRARTQAIQGFGLGLHIVRNILRAHGGDIELRSSVGVGTTAVMTLPRVIREQ